MALSLSCQYFWSLIFGSSGLVSFGLGLSAASEFSQQTGLPLLRSSLEGLPVLAGLRLLLPCSPQFAAWPVRSAVHKRFLGRAHRTVATVSCSGRLASTEASALVLLSRTRALASMNHLLQARSVLSSGPDIARWRICPRCPTAGWLELPARSTKDPHTCSGRHSCKPSLPCLLFTFLFRQVGKTPT